MSNVKRFMSMSEEQAREYLESLRWPNGPVCAHCGAKEVTKLQGKATRPGVYKCKAKACRKQFTVTVGTIFERSHVKMSDWIKAFYLMCCSKKGISALQLQRMLGIASYQTAWFINHRVRWAMRQEPLKGLMTGIVEADETWVGPKRRAPIDNDWQQNKTAVVALIQRGGEARVRVMPRVTKANLKAVLDENVDRSAIIQTDELQAYRYITAKFKRHDRVNHSKGEYSRGNAHVNSAESFFSLLKRGIHGSFHHVGQGHLFRYADEFAFRWTHRKVSDAERTEAALGSIEGKRLFYRRPSA
jgi:transposase-like protein